MNADQLRASYQARRDQAMQRLQALALARNQYMQQQQHKAEALYQKSVAQERYAKSEGNKNWLNMAGQGAMVGASSGNPYGALIGGAIGAVAGIAGSVSERHHKGDNWWDTVKHTGDAVIHPAGNRFDGMSDIPLGGMVAGGLAAGSAAGLGANSPQGSPYAGDQHGLGYNGKPTAGGPTPEELAALEYHSGQPALGAPEYPATYQGAQNNYVSSLYDNQKVPRQY